MDKQQADPAVITLTGRDYELYLAGVHVGRAEGLRTATETVRKQLTEWLESVKKQAENDPKMAANIKSYEDWYGQFEQMFKVIFGSSDREKIAGQSLIGRLTSSPTPPPSLRRSVGDAIIGAVDRLTKG